MCKKTAILFVFYLFCVNGQNYLQLNSSIYANDVSATAAGFGDAAHFENDTLVIGADVDNSSGSAYIFKRNGSNWIQTQKLIASDGQAGDQFGNSVFRFNTTIFVGAISASIAGFQFAGKVYIFQYNGFNWIQTQILIDPSPQSTNDNFGFEILLHNGYLLISAPGFANGIIHLYTYNGTSWNYYQPITTNITKAYFGYSFSCLNNLLIVGAISSYNNSGSVHIFEFNGTTWIESDLIMSPQSNSNFGSAIQITNKYLFIGAVGAFNNEGAIYIYKIVNNKWQQVNIFLPIGITPSDTLFGSHITVSNKLAIVGYSNDNANGTAFYSGSIYLYYFNDVDWVHFESLTFTNNQAFNSFGSSVCIYQNYIFVGATGINTTGAGFIYYQTLFDNTQIFSESNISQSYSLQDSTKTIKSDTITYVIIGSVSGTAGLIAISASAYFGGTKIKRVIKLYFSIK